MATLTLQPDGTAGLDAHLSAASPTTNFGTSGFLAIGFTSAAAFFRAILEFDISAIPAENSVVSATLTLTLNQVSTSAEPAEIIRMSQAAWTEAGVTWNTYDGSNAWTSPGGDSAGSAISWTLALAGTEVAIDCTAIASDAHVNQSGILRLLLKRTTEGGTLGRNRFASSENATAGDRPELVVVHSASWRDQDYPGRYGYWVQTLRT